MHYIRLLKTPRFSARAGDRIGSVSALVTITSDLGDSFFPRDATITTKLLRKHGSAEEQLVSREFQWRMGMRAIRIELGFILSKATFAGVASLILSVISDAIPIADNISCSVDRGLEIISAYSPSFNLIDGSEAERLVQRRFNIGLDNFLTIWEETGESIARHIWDGGLALTAYLAQNVSRDDHGTDKLSALHNQLISGRSLRILEVGSGCGIVGLALALLHDLCHVTMTDLPLAGDLLQRNLKTANLQGKAVFEALDWDQPIPKCLASPQWDIILVADCTYNVSSAPSLVGILTKLVGNSLDTVVVLAHKKRHASEDLFFELMDALFVVVDRICFVSGDQETETPVDIYTFRLGSKGL